MADLIKRVVWHQFAGWVCRGGPASRGPVDPALHVDRAVFLTETREAGNKGTVQGYDGVGMSGGPIHLIATYRDGSQGRGFWAMVSAAIAAAPDVGQEITELLDVVGMRLSGDGVVLWTDGKPVDGRRLRDAISAPHGFVPTSGPYYQSSRAWCLAFHHLLVDPRTYPAQSRAAARYLLEGQRDVERRAYELLLGREIPATTHTKVGELEVLQLDLYALRADELPPAGELAMCVYHSFSANAPSEAARDMRAELADSVARHEDADRFAHDLVQSLVTDHYARWPERGSATRLAALAHPELWPRAVVEAVFP